MSSLGASQAAVIADKVYAVRDNDIEKAIKLSNGLGLGDEFKIAQQGGFQGTSGPLIFKSRTGFGYLTEGQGKRQGEVLVAIRGTVPGIQDIGTDLNIGLQIGPTGWPVHAGFNDTFKSFKKELHDYFINKNPTHVHCVGHSLGGALATITAAWLSDNKIAGASLYTFGSPRTGTIGFSHSLTRNMKAENIYRVHHTADPISMIPLFPFSHVPISNAGITLNWPGSLIAPSAHMMENYINSIGNNSWNGLHSSSSALNTGDKIETWLDSASSQNVLMHSAKILWMLAKALAWLIKKIVIGVVGTALAISATLLDQLSWILKQGVLASAKIAGFVNSLMLKILQFLGRGASMVGSLTTTFIHWVLSLLFSTIQNFASHSLNMIYRI